MAERPVPYLKSENQIGFDEGKAHVQRLLKFATDEKNKLVNKRETAAKKWFKEHDLPYQDEAARKPLDDELKPPRHVGLSQTEQGQLKVREQDERIWTPPFGTIRAAGSKCLQRGYFTGEVLIRQETPFAKQDRHLSLA